MMELLKAIIVLLKTLFGNVEDKETSNAMEKLANKLQGILLHNAISKNSRLSDSTKDVLNTMIDNIVESSENYIDLARYILDEIDDYKLREKGNFALRYYKIKSKIPFIRKYVVSVCHNNIDIIRYRTNDEKKINIGYVLDKYNIECNRIYEYCSPYTDTKFRPKHVYKKSNSIFRKNKYVLSRNGKLCAG